jgi:hypothetical protein
MSKTRPDVLKAAEEFGNWDEHIRACDAVGGMTDDEKEKTRRALQYLRGELGEKFLRRAFIKGHPIVGPVLNATRRDRLWFVELAETLEELREAEGFPEVFRRFKKPEDSIEAESVLSTAFRFKKAGFSIAFDPRVTVTRQDGQRRQKRPDLKLVNGETGEEVIVEVSALERSDAHRKAFDISGVTMPLLNVLRPANLMIYMEMKEGFDDSYAAEAVRLLTEAAGEVARTGEFRAVVNERMVAGIAPEDNDEQLRRWAEGQGVSPWFTGPPIYSDEISRARTKIRDKLAQLPEDGPGLIVIPATPSMLFNFYDPRLILGVLREEVSRYPRLWAVVLLHNYVGGPQREPVVMRLESSVLIDKAEAEVFHQQTAILLNEACALPVSRSTSEKLLKAFA